ncbi:MULTISPECIES: zinc ribbon domain-containing protein [Streptomyces]|uniref:ChsH2 rubredoxin-like zinc ribbon domain-containing protein n=2 Tax=Streptomyces TaxID=1883 RepID=A0A0B5FAV2_STRA4|nr:MULTISPECIES: zinc ribbon domain-containing protein [Streptomyces]AJE87597.1 hypothetical protein SLNWT_7221 [Streptomyces albus]AOU81898.1 hypothetical protein SLNHY_7207 [Streptomyces albus]AYN37583.1 hypothetical protein DUI70_7090 [Streptomyces albus]NKI45218.1 hypothetical protein [Streptomyces physcomitrii]
MFELTNRTAVLDREVQPSPPAAELYFQRCRWCGTALYQRLLCTGCGSTELDTERSEGRGVVCTYRRLSTDRDRWPVTMNEGFTVWCRVAGSLPMVRPGARVRLATTVEPTDEPVVELCRDSWDEPLPQGGLRRF